MTFVMSKGCGGYGHGERTDTTSCLTRASLSRPNLIKWRCNIDEDGFEEAASGCARLRTPPVSGMKASNMGRFLISFSGKELALLPRCTR